MGPAARLIRAHARALVRTAGLVALAGAVPVAILTDFVEGSWGEAGPAEAMPPAAIAGQGMTMLVDFLLSALVLLVAFQVFLHLSRPLELRRPAGAMGAYLLSLAAATVPLLAVGLLAVGVGAVASQDESAGALVLILVLMLVVLVATAYLYASLALSMILVISEDLPVRAALRTSWRRMPGQRLRWFGGQLALGLLLLPVLLLASVLFSGLPTFASALLFTAIGSLASAAVIGAVTTVVYTDTLPPQPADPAGDPGEAAPG